jgi:hypothetical protein
MSIKLLLFFVFCFFSERWFSTDKNIKTIHNYLKALETTIQTVNEKNPNLLQPIQKSLISCILELNKYLINYKSQQLEEYLNINPSKNWMHFIQEELLVPLVTSINKNEKIKLNKLFEEINKDSFKKNIQDTVVKNSGKIFDGKVLWRQYQYLILAILITDYFKINIAIDFEDDYLYLASPKVTISLLTRKNNPKESYTRFINQFLSDHLVKFAIDWNILADINIQINNQPQLSPMDNDTFLQTFKDPPLSSSQPYVSKIKIDGPIRTLIVQKKEEEKFFYKSFYKRIEFKFISVILTGTGLIVFFKKKKKTTDLNKLIKSTEKKIAQMSFEINQLKQKNQRMLMANG